MIYCTVGFVLLFSSILMHFFPKQNTLNDTLTPELKEKYKQIIEERLKIYIMGTIFGLIVAIAYIYLYPNGYKSICMFILIVMSIKLTFYY